MYYLPCLSKRCNSILSILMNQRDALTTKELARAANVGVRSVYYDIAKINELFMDENAPLIETSRNAGILLCDAQKDCVRKMDVNKNHKSLIYGFTPTERAYIIIAEIILHERNLNIEHFQDVCSISRNTVISDLKMVSSLLSTYELSIEYKNKLGYQISGNVIKKRALYFYVFSFIEQYYKIGIIPLENHEEINDCLLKLHKIEESLETQYVDGILFAIAGLIPTMKKSHDLLSFSMKDRLTVMNSQAYELVYREFPKLRNDERIYLALHLLGSRLQTEPGENFNTADPKVMDLAIDLVKEFERISCIEFKNSSDLVHSLYQHLRTSLYRLRYGIQIGNPMLTEIKDQYPELFNMTKYACKYLENYVGSLISDSEIAYLTMLFGGYVRSKEKRGSSMRIMIVCPNGISTSTMLKAEVETLVDEDAVIDTVSASNYAEHADSYDVIISTIPLNNVESSVIIVKPVLTEENRIQILNRCVKNTVEKRGTLNVNELLEILRPYVKKEDLPEISEKLREYRAHFGYDGMVVGKVQYPGVKELLYEHVYESDEKCDWRKALEISSNSMVEEGYIEPCYVDAIEHLIEEYGSYMFFGENSILAHASIEDGSKKLGLSCTRFKYPVAFPEGKHAEAIFVLSTDSKSSHLRVIKELTYLLADSEREKELLSCAPKEVIDCITRLIGTSTFSNE